MSGSLPINWAYLLSSRSLRVRFPRHLYIWLGYYETYATESQHGQDKEGMVLDQASSGKAILLSVSRSMELLLKLSTSPAAGSKEAHAAGSGFLLSHT